MSEIVKRTAENDDDVEQSTTDGAAAQLWVRRPVCGARTTVVDRLGALRSAGVVDDVAIETWPDEVVLDDENDQRIPEQVATLETWAMENDLSLRPPFETRTVSPLVGASRDVLTLPVMTLAIRDSEGLTGVYPCSDGDRTLTVTDYLDACERAGTALGYRSLVE